jgi:hypothetical protein
MYFVQVKGSRVLIKQYAFEHLRNSLYFEPNVKNLGSAWTCLENLSCVHIVELPSIPFSEPTVTCVYIKNNENEIGLEKWLEPHNKIRSKTLYKMFHKFVVSLFHIWM